MELLLKRIARRDGYTIGHLYIDGRYFCDTVEDTDRGMRQDDAYAANKRKKIAGQTAIPTGRYQVTLGVQSPRFSKKKQYAFCINSTKTFLKLYSRLQEAEGPIYIKIE